MPLHRREPDQPYLAKLQKFSIPLIFNCLQEVHYERVQHENVFDSLSQRERHVPASLRNEQYTLERHSLA